MTEVEGSAETAPYEVGQFIGGQYRVEAFLGGGSLGTVFRVVDRELNEPLAIKVIHARLARFPNIIERFRESIRKIRRISCPGIVTIQMFGREGDHYFIVMEFVAGDNLEQVLASKTLPFSAARKMLISLCNSLEPVHQAGIIHGNLKPRNIIITPAGLVKVIDFGFTIPEDLARFPGLFDPRYMAPEQNYPEASAAAIDLYALGIILYQMLTGTVPISGTNDQETALAQVTDVPSPPSALVADLPAIADLLVRRLLDKEPSRRFGSVKELREVLTENLAICSRCLGVHPAGQVCPVCRRQGEESPAQEAHGGRVPALETKKTGLLTHEEDSLKKVKDSINRNLEVSSEFNCYYCGQQLPHGFPFCPQCYLDAPFARRGEPGMIIVTGVSRKDRRNAVLRYLRGLTASATIPDSLQRLNRFCFLIRIQDDPERAVELIAEIQERGGEARLIDPDDLMEMLRFNSWVGPGAAAVLTLICLAPSTTVALIPFFAMFALIYRNMKSLHLPTLSVTVANKETIFPAQLRKGALDLSYRLKENKFLNRVLDSILFSCFELLSLMKKDREAENVFAEIITSIEHLLASSFRTIDVLLMLERQVNPGHEGWSKTDAVDHGLQFIQEADGPIGRPVKPAAIDEETQASLKKMREHLLQHYTAVLDIIRNLGRMKVKVSTIIREIYARRLSASEEDRAIIRDVLAELTALEEGFKELGSAE